MTYYVSYNTIVEKVYIEIEDPDLLKKFLTETEDYTRSTVYNNKYDKGQDLCGFVMDMRKALEDLKEHQEEKKPEKAIPTFSSYTPGLLEDE